MHRIIALLLTTLILLPVTSFSQTRKRSTKAPRPSTAQHHVPPGSGDPCDHPRLEGDGKLVRTMRFGDLGELVEQCRVIHPEEYTLPTDR